MVWLLLAAGLLFATGLQAQFYNGSNMTFGKNRVQYNDFLWTYYKFDDFDTYFYLNGKELAQFTARYASKQIPLIENKLESRLDKRIKFIIFNNLTDLKQSNIGLMTNESYNTGGVTHIIGTKVFLYFDGNHIHFQDEIRAGIAQVMFNQMMFGGSLGRQVKTSTFFSLPDWYKEGIISWLSKDWSVEYDNRVRDGILSGRYEKVNNLEGEDAVYAGHSLWRFIALQYGRSTVSNIIHMTGVSNSIEKGILYVLGIPFKKLVEEWRMFYQQEYEKQMALSQPSNLLPMKYKSDRVVGQPRLSPFGKYIAYTTNEMGKYKIFIQDLATGKRKKILKKGVMIDTKTDYSYPLLAWHPTGKLLTYVIEYQGLVWLYMYNLEEKKTTRQVLYEVQKVVDFSYSDDGRYLVMSAVRKGQSDVFVFNISANTFRPITNDIYSDLHPRFINNSRQIVFSSNRVNDTLGIEPENPGELPANFDLFVYNFAQPSPVLRRITQTPLANEMRPEPYGFNTISYLSDENGIYNNYLAVLDSMVSSVDTAIHYRYFIHSKAVSNYGKNILDQHVNLKSGKKAMLYYDNNLWKIFVEPALPFDDAPSLTLENTAYMDGLKKTLAKAEAELKKKKEQSEAADQPETPQEQLKPIARKKHFVMVYIDNKGNEFIGKPKKQGDGLKNDQGYESLITTIEGRGDDGELTIPKRRNYYTEYFLNDMISQIDFNYINYSYQPFTGGGPIYLNPGFNVFFQMGVNDLMEDHRFVGGVRLNFNFKDNEYLFSYSNLKRRLDHEIIFHRNSYDVSFYGTPYYGRIHTHEIFYLVKWPFNEALSLRGTLKYRNDMNVLLATDLQSLDFPNQFNNWVGLKAELVFDNTRSLGMNLYTGTRYKIFAEYEQLVAIVQDGQVIDPESKYNYVVLGADFRHYTRIHRNFIWANRFAASTSFGASPLIYYMGGVDNWVAPKFNYDTPIDYSQNYAYQTLATNMRGFDQNIRNGNSFVLINSELRFPIFQYFSKTPLSSGFLRNFQLVSFGDIGTAWTGLSPYAKDNALYTHYVDSGPYHISVEVQKEPIVGGFGFGARMHLLGYFIRGDISWGVEDYKVSSPVYYFSLSLDF